MTGLIEKWRLRHAYPDALGMWANATGPEARELAFTAIAQDPGVLHRAARPQAIKLVAQAEDFLQSLDHTIDGNGAWNAATQLVRQSIDAWRRSPRVYGHRIDGATLSLESAVVLSESSDPWEAARRNFPSVDDATGRLATRLLHEFGSTLLRRARRPWDHVIALAILRYAARRLRGDVTEYEPSFTATAAVADILAVQSYAEETGLSPMLVGYSGRGKPAAQALSLARDARTLRDAVRVADGGGEARASLWQCAIDFHAFAVVALDHGMLLQLPLQDAYALAEAALRHAEAAIQAPEQVAMPRLPSDSASAPDVVRLHARACLPPEAQPTATRYERTGGEATNIARMADTRAPSALETDADWSGA